MIKKGDTLICIQPTSYGLKKGQVCYALSGIYNVGYGPEVMIEYQEPFDTWFKVEVSTRNVVNLKMLRNSKIQKILK